MAEEDMRNRVHREQERTRAKQLETRKLIHDAFPSMGTMQPAYQGSQSIAPSKEMPYSTPLQGQSNIGQAPYEPNEDNM
jgi:hypothetical protein